MKSGVEGPAEHLLPEVLVRPSPPHSPFFAGFARSQFGTKSLFVSVHDRVVLMVDADQRVEVEVAVGRR